MNPGAGTIGVLQNTMIVLLCVGLMNHVLIVPQVLEQGGRDAWISVLGAGALLLLWIPILNYSMSKLGNQHLVDWMKERFHRGLAWLFVIPFSIYLFLMGFITIRDTSTWLTTSNLPQTPMMVTSTVFVVLCFFAAKSGIRTIAITSGILLPFVIALGYFAAFANEKFKDYRLLMPFFEHGMAPVFKGMIYSGAGMVELIIVVLLRRHVKSGYKWWQLLIVGIIVIRFLFGTIMAAIAEFGPFVSSIQRYPAFEEWRLIKIGKHFEHMDFLVIYQWTAGAFIRISTILFLIVDILHLKDEKKRTIALVIVALLMLGLSQVPMSDPLFMMLLTKYYFPITLVMMLLCSFLLFLFAFFSKKKQGSARV